MNLDILKAIISPVVLTGAFRLATPVIIGSVGGCFTNRAGTFILAYESFMLTAAFFATWGSYATGSPLIGSLCGILAAIVMGLIFGILAFNFDANHLIISIALNYGAWAITTQLLVSVFKVRGTFFSPKITSYKPIKLPFLSKIPLLNTVFNNKIGLVYFAYLFIIVAWVIMYRTRYGLRLRGVGMNPTATQTTGVNLPFMRWTSLVLMSAACGLAGSYFPLSGISQFSENMTAGRGGMCFAAVLVGGGNPLKTGLVALLFGYTDALFLTLTGFQLPTQLVACIPYVVVILTMLVSKLRESRLGVGTV